MDFFRERVALVQHDLKDDGLDQREQVSPAPVQDDGDGKRTAMGQVPEQDGRHNQQDADDNEDPPVDLLIKLRGEEAAHHGNDGVGQGKGNGGKTIGLSRSP